MVFEAASLVLGPVRPQGRIPGAPRPGVSRTQLQREKDLTFTALRRNIQFFLRTIFWEILILTVNKELFTYMLLKI